MKKIRSILVLCTITLCLVWCEEQPTLEGNRETSNEQGTFTYHFGSGEGSYEINEETYPFTYTKTEESINFLYQGDESENRIAYSISGNLLKMIDNFGNEISYIKKDQQS